MRRAVVAEGTRRSRDTRGNGSIGAALLQLWCWIISCARLRVERRYRTGLFWVRARAARAPRSCTTVSFTRTSCCSKGRAAPRVQMHPGP